MSGAQTSPDGLRSIYDRCDVSNNQIDRPMGFDEFTEALVAWADRRTAAVLSRLQNKSMPYYTFSHMNIDGSPSGTPRSTQAVSLEFVRREFDALNPPKENS